LAPRLELMGVLTVIDSNALARCHLWDALAFRRPL
jgi:hypothetical protein